MKKNKLISPAKINLTLEVVKKLPNGFHALRSVMLKLKNLYDEIEIFFNKSKKGIRIECSDKNVPEDKNNICSKVAEKFFEITKNRTGLDIKIKKIIPVSAGMGGGSSNGATVLLALNKYFKNPLSKKELIEIASEVGKDIPFFLEKENAGYMSGMGEKILPIKNFPKFSFLIIKPNGKISTPLAFAELDRKMQFIEDSAKFNISRKFILAVQEKKDISGFLYNDFDLVAEEKYPQIKSIKKALISFGAQGTSLSGKGPTVFGIFKNKKEALQAKISLKKYFPGIFIELG